MKQIHALKTEQEHYKEVMSPFEEFLPLMRPSNSDDYLLRLAMKMRQHGLSEEDALARILSDSPISLDEETLPALVHQAYDADAGEVSPTVADKAKALIQRKTYDLHDFMDRRYALRYNVVLDVVEYCEDRKLHTSWRRLDQRAFNSIVENAREEGIDLWDRDLNRYLHSDRVRLVNPFDEFIAGLPKWDGKKRIEKWFRCIPTDDEAWYPLARTWFLGMVALWMGANRRKGNETMLVLLGDQGGNKSTFLRSLLPPAMEPYFTENFALNDRRKALLMMSRYGLINFDEMDRLTEHQQPVLKNMLQLPTVDEYKPYASASTSMQRYASFAGSSNVMSVIKDLTGSRRYLCANVTGDIKMKKDINYPQLYAEAVAEIRRGTRYWLNDEEEKALTERNLRFVCMPPEVQRVDTVFDVVPLGTKGARWYYATEINQRLHPTVNKPMTTAELRHLSSFLKSQNAVWRRGNAGIQYYLLEKTPS